MRSDSLEPCAGMTRTHGSEGRTAQRCIALTRHTYRELSDSETSQYGSTNETPPRGFLDLSAGRVVVAARDKGSPNTSQGEEA